MRQDDVLVLARYVYWMRDRVLDAAATLEPDAFADGPAANGRTLQETLVHELDVEWSWRERLRGATTPKGEPEAELQPAAFPSVDSLRRRWRADEDEMLAWLDGLDDDALAFPPATGGDAGLPLWAILVHVMEHGVQQLTGAAMILTTLGASPGDLDFLDAVDAHGGDPSLQSPATGGPP